MSNRRRKTTKKQSSAMTFFVCVVVLVVLGVSAVKVSNLCEKSKELSETEYALEVKIQNAYLEKQDLIAQEQYMQTKQYIEDVAKDKLGLVYPDEIVIKPSE
ncbi:MAG: septum formation initiator family protein [Lachnospiraceae bacterium]|nr:septum formation initiator family protein [Lachnospiraceae bacterium]